MKGSWLMLLTLLALTLSAYAPLRFNDWVYEDSNAVFANPAVLGREPIAVDRARWISALSHRFVFLVNRTPQATHAINLGLHLVNGCLVYAVAATWIAGPGALVAAGAFLLHPIQTEAVAYAASRSELLAATCALAALLLLIRGRVTVWRGLAMVLLLGLAFGSKETSVVMIGLMVWYLLTFRPPQAKRAVGPLTAAVFVAGAVAVSVFLFDHRQIAEHTRIGYAALQACAFWRYLGLVLLPVGQTIDHDFELVAMGWRILAALGVVWLVGLVVACWLGRVIPVVTFALAWPLIALSPRAVMRIPEVLNEHQMYLPFIGIWLAVGVVAHCVLTDTVPWMIGGLAHERT